MAEMIRHRPDLVEGLNLVLLGKIGAGKSASGNTILGRKAFESKESFTSVTLDLAVESGTVCGRRVTVYDTPGLFNTKLSEEEIQQIYAKVLQRCESGPCVFLLVIKADRFTGKERQTVLKIEELLGENRLKKTWILFTGRDELEEENISIDEFFSETEQLMRLVQKYDQRYHVFNNKKKEPNGQVQELLRKIDATHPDTAAKPKQTVVTRPKMNVKSMMTVISIPPECSEGVTDSAAEAKFPVSLAALDAPDTSRGIVFRCKTGVGKRASGNTMEEERRQREEKQSQEEIERVRKETEERVRAEFEGPPRFLQESLKSMRLREEEPQEELERAFHHLMLQCRHIEMQRKEEEKQRLEEIERVMKEIEKRVRAVCEGPLRFLQERFKSIRLREKERRPQEAELKRPFLHQMLGPRHMEMQRKEEEQRLEEIESVIKESEKRMRAECEGPLRFLQERLKQMRLREEERRLREEEPQEELERTFHRLMLERSHMGMQRKEEEQRLEEIESVIKETEERVRAVCEGPLRFLIEKLESMRLREKERRQRQEEPQEEPERAFHHLMLEHRHMGMQRKEEEEQRLEEIERVIKETEKRVRAECEGPLRFLLERLESMRLREKEWRPREAERQEELVRAFHHLMSHHRHMGKHIIEMHMEEMYIMEILMEEMYIMETHMEEIYIMKRHMKEMYIMEMHMKEMYIMEMKRKQEIESVIKETEERVRAVCEGPLRFVQERLKSMRLREAERQVELEKKFHHLMLERRHMGMQRKEEKEQRLEEIESVSVIKESEKRVRAECEDPLRFLLERLESMRLREKEWRPREAERQEELERAFHHLMLHHRHMGKHIIEMHKEMQGKQEEIERVIKETKEKIRAEFEGPPRSRQERFKSMKLREDERKRQEEIEWRIKELKKLEELEEPEEQFRAELSPPRFKLRNVFMRPREERERQRQDEKQRREEIEKVIKETEEKIRAEFEGPPSFLLERLQQMRQREEERRQQEEEEQEELKGVIYTQHSPRRLMAIRLKRKQQEKQRQEEIESVIKETEERIRAEFKGTPRESEKGDRGVSQKSCVDSLMRVHQYFYWKD